MPAEGPRARGLLSRHVPAMFDDARQRSGGRAIVLICQASKAPVHEGQAAASDEASRRQPDGGIALG